MSAPVARASRAVVERPGPAGEMALAADDELNVGLLVRYAFRAFTRMLQILVTPSGLTPAEFRVLRTLSTGGPLTQLQIAALAGMDRPYAALIAKRLLGRGLIERRADPIDKRRVAMTLSARGVALTSAIAEELAGVNRVAVEGVSAGDLATFIAVCARMRSNLEGLEQRRTTGAAAAKPMGPIPDL